MLTPIAMAMLDDYDDEYECVTPTTPSTPPPPPPPPADMPDMSDDDDVDPKLLPFLYDHGAAVLAASLEALKISCSSPVPPPAPSLSLVKVKDMKSIALLDNSWSTSGDILEWETQMAEAFQVDSAASWNDAACYYQTRQELCIVPAGGTSPVCLFSDSEVTEALKEASCVLFSTDGRIDPDDVKAFSNDVSTHFGHFSLIVCVLVTYRSDEYGCAPGDIDTSVFGSLLLLPRVILLHLEGNDLRVF